MIALIQLRESPWLEFPGSISAVGKETMSKGHITGGETFVYLGGTRKNSS